MPKIILIDEVLTMLLQRNSAVFLPHMAVAFAWCARGLWAAIWS